LGLKTLVQSGSTSDSVPVIEGVLVGHSNQQIAAATH
jgi:hypothetical protein